MKYCLLLMLSVLMAPALANDCAESQKSKLDYSRCLDMSLEQKERELESWQTSHLLTLQQFAEKTGRVDPLHAYERSRQHFRKFSTDYCRWQYLVLLPDNQQAAIKYKVCMLEQVQNQIDLLSQTKAFPGTSN